MVVWFFQRDVLAVKNAIEFFEPMRLPKTTPQAKKFNTATRRLYDDSRLAEARQCVISHIAKYRPAKRLTGALGLELVLVYEPTGKHKPGQPYTQKPDWDNATKLIQDAMAACQFMEDDKQIVCAKVTQAYGQPWGLYVKLYEI